MRKHILFVLMLIALSLAATAQNKKMKIAVIALNPKIIMKEDADKGKREGFF